MAGESNTPARRRNPGTNLVIWIAAAIVIILVVVFIWWAIVDDDDDAERAIEGDTVGEVLPTDAPSGVDPGRAITFIDGRIVSVAA